MQKKIKKNRTPEIDDYILCTVDNECRDELLVPECYAFLSGGLICQRRIFFYHIKMSCHFRGEQRTEILGDNIWGTIVKLRDDACRIGQGRNPYTFLYTICIQKKFSCRREAARHSMSLEILLSHSTSSSREWEVQRKRKGKVSLNWLL